MDFFIKWIWLSLLISIASASDLVAVYHQNVLLLRDVDQMKPLSSNEGNQESDISWESLKIEVPEPLYYPVGVTYDPEDHRLFVADAGNTQTIIYAIYLAEGNAVEKMQPIFMDNKYMVMEDLSYDPRTKYLYWTDSYNHAVYKTLVPDKNGKSDHPSMEPANKYGDVVEPRGIAIDYCNELLYWSERDRSGNVPSSIEMCHLDTTSHSVVRQAAGERINIYYQGLTFDFKSGKLLWAETVGDSIHKSACQIVSYEFGEDKSKQEVLVSKENCYPFSLTTDENFIYWADWGQQGIMRAPRDNPQEPVKLVHAPEVNSTLGKHNGVYGLAILGDYKDETLQKACKKRENLNSGPALNQASEDQAVNDFSASMMVKENKQIGESNLEQSNQNTDEAQKIYPVEYDNDNDDNDHSLKKDNHKDTAEVEKSSLDNVSNNDDSLLSFQNDAPQEEIQSHEGIIEGKIEEPSSGELKDTFHMCTEKELTVVVCVLGIFCSIFMLSTLFLVYKIWGRQRRPQAELSAVITDKATIASPPRQPKRFGPKPKPKVFHGGISSSSCSRGDGGDDGLTINIEDCCQMTLCDTPCYTTVRKEGKSYKNSLIHKCSKNGDDKQGLLDDLEDFSAM